MSPTAFSCNYCLCPFPNNKSVRRHQARSPECQRQRNAYREQLTATASGPPHHVIEAAPIPVYEPSPDVEVSHHMDVDDALDTNDSIHDTDACRPRQQQVTVEEILDKDAPKIWVDSFPSEKKAGAKGKSARTGFETIHNEQILRGSEVLGPFRDHEEWELAKWLIKNVGHGQAEEFLKLPIIQNRVNPLFSTKDQLLNTIDSLPKGVKWNLHHVHMTGDLLDDDGNPLRDTLEFWWRDPVECVRELLGNPVFRDVLKYAPEHLFTDSSKTERVIDEMWTADWWHRLQ
ncbi:hypothetical protein DXG01_009879, partial [Tephrocybe rancida]